MEDYLTKTLGTTTAVTVSGTMPSTGWMYVTIHLDYGLLKTYSWERSGETAVNKGLGLKILEPQNYIFSFTSGAVTDTETAQSVNEFKKVAGFLGLVTGDCPDGYEGVEIDIYKVGVEQPIGTTLTDEDGYYLFPYKHTGKAAKYVIKVPEFGLFQEVTLKSNGFIIADFDAGTSCPVMSSGLTSAITAESTKPIHIQLS
jgi:hypothetical protein